MDPKTLRQKKADAQKLPVTVTVGKNGITDATLEELERHLKKEKLVKVRLLKSATYEQGMQEQAEALAERSGATLIDVRGGTACYWRG